MRVIKLIILVFYSLIGTVFAQIAPLKAMSDSTQLIFCDVTPLEGHVVISWATAIEKNNAFFTIEKSKDGKKFIKVIDVPGAGDSKQYLEYVESDYQPFKENSFYRIKHTDINGNIRYFPTTGVIFNSHKLSKQYPPQATPTPATEPKSNEGILVVLQNAEGIDFSGKVTITQENNQLFASNENNSIPPGIYIIISSSDENIYSQRIIVK